MSDTKNLNPGPKLDFRDFGLPNILPQGGESQEDDPFCGEVPDDNQGYSAYRSFHEAKMNKLIGGSKQISIHINCETQGEGGRPIAMRSQKPGHEGSGIVIACHHVIHQDPHNPEGVRFYPLYRGEGSGFFLCKTCMRSEERHKLNFDTGVSMKCAKCVLEAIMKINETHPDRLINLQAL